MKRTLQRLGCLLLAAALVLHTLPAAAAQAKLSTVSDFTREFAAHVDAREDSFSLVCTSALYDALLQDDLLSAICKNCGVFQYQATYTQKKGLYTLTFQGMTWYAGKRIAAAVKAGKTSALTSREQQALQIALVFASLLNGTELEKERAIHDYLCEHITYTKDDKGFDENDCAIGALLNGKADCDGYSDAFYLLCSLAGIQARHVHGKSTESKSDNGHMWNAVCIGGQWVMTDVTWDDNDPGVDYLHFNIGAARMALDHTWDEAALPVPVAATAGAAQRGGLKQSYAADWEQIAFMLRQQAAARPERISLTFPAGLNVKEESDRLRDLVRLSGVKNFSWAFAPDSFEIYNIEYYDAFGYFTTEQDAVDFINRCDVSPRPGEILLAFSDALAQRLFANNCEALNRLLYSTNLEAPIDWTYWENKCRALVMQPSFQPLTTVNSWAELLAYLRAALATRPGEITFCYGGTLDFSNDIEPVLLAARRLGVDGKFYYKDYGGRIWLSSMTYFQAFKVVDTYEEAMDYLRGCRRAGVKSFRIYCSEALYRQLNANNVAAFFRMLEQAGFKHYKVYHYDSYFALGADEAY